METTHIASCDKTILRARATALRESLGQDARIAADCSTARSVARSDVFADAPLVLGYCSFGSEVDTHALIKKALEQGKTVALPRCAPGTGLMTWHTITALADLAPGFSGILEPLDDPATLIDPQTTDARALALVPGLLFDDAGYRLGYGGGYYDRFLASFPGVSLGLTRTAQRVPDLRALGAVEAFDKPVSLIADETGLYPAVSAPTTV